MHIHAHTLTALCLPGASALGASQLQFCPECYLPSSASQALCTPLPSRVRLQASWTSPCLSDVDPSEGQQDPLTVSALAPLWVPGSEGWEPSPPWKTHEQLLCGSA